MLVGVLARGLHAAICTGYYPRFPDAALQKVAVAAQTVFNDCIVHASFTHRRPLLDLRLICTEVVRIGLPIANGACWPPMPRRSENQDYR